MAATGCNIHYTLQYGHFGETNTVLTIIVLLDPYKWVSYQDATESPGSGFFLQGALLISEMSRHYITEDLVWATNGNVAERLVLEDITAINMDQDLLLIGFLK